MNTEVVWNLIHRSQEFNEGPRAHLQFDRLVVAYDFETEDGSYRWEEFSFRGVVAFTFTAMSSCNEDQISAYDQLVVVTNSDWPRSVGELREEVHHYRIFFDEAGCYEVLAAEFRPPQTDS